MPDEPSVELADAKLEVLRLRDLLIGRDAELRAARAQLAERPASGRASAARRRFRPRPPQALQTLRIRFLELRSRQR